MAGAFWSGSPMVSRSVVTLDGRPIAELRPLPGRALAASTLLARWRRLPPIDLAAFRADLDRTVDATL